MMIEHINYSKHVLSGEVIYKNNQSEEALQRAIKLYWIKK